MDRCVKEVGSLRAGGDVEVPRGTGDVRSVKVCYPSGEGKRKK